MDGQTNTPKPIGPLGAYQCINVQVMPLTSWGGGGLGWASGGGGRGRWMDRRTGPSQLDPSGITMH